MRAPPQDILLLKEKTHTFAVRRIFVVCAFLTHTLSVSTIKNEFETTVLHVDVNFVINDELDINKFKSWRDEFNDAEFILENAPENKTKWQPDLFRLI